MKREQKKSILFAMILGIILILILLPGAGPAYANSPVAQLNFYITVENAPADAYAVDFLVPKDQIDLYELGFTDLNEHALSNAGFPVDCGLAQYEEDGYVSLLCHAKEATFDGELMDWTGKLECPGYESGYGLLTSGYPVRLALTDHAGEILLVSEPFSSQVSTNRHFYGEVILDASDGTIRQPGFEEAESGGFLSSILENAFMIVFMLIALAVALGLTIGIELLIALAFRLKPVWWVIPVNLLTNVVFNLLLIVLCMVLEMIPYMGYVIVGEIIVIVVEYFIYRRIYKEYSGRRILCYSIVSNVISAILPFLLGLAAA